ncbi:MAG: lipoprotein [Chromatiales bacterium]|jgi:predicted small lipoprotein YifL
MHRWARYTLLICVAALATGGMLSACGQKGDLYLPDRDKSETQQADDGR